MFKVTQSPTYWSKARATFVGERGEQVEATIEVQFRRMPMSRIDELTERLRASREDGAPLGDKWFVQQIVNDWRGVVGDDDQPLTFTDDNVAMLCDLGWTPGILEAFWHSLPKAKGKN